MADYTQQNANELTILDDPDSGQSFILVDKTSNIGYLLDYNKLADAILNKVSSGTMDSDSAKIYFVS